MQLPAPVTSSGAIDHGSAARRRTELLPSSSAGKHHQIPKYRRAGFSRVQLRLGATCKHVTAVIGSLNGATRQGWPEIAE